MQLHTLLWTILASICMLVEAQDLTTTVVDATVTSTIMTTVQHTTTVLCSTLSTSTTSTNSTSTYSPTANSTAVYSTAYNSSLIIPTVRANSTATFVASTGINTPFIIGSSSLPTSTGSAKPSASSGAAHGLPVPGISALSLLVGLMGMGWLL